MQPSATKHATSQALRIILDRLHAMAQRRTSAADADLETTLLGLPRANRSQVLLVLESLESRAQARDDEGMAHAARSVRKTADQVWAEQREADLDDLWA